MALKPLLLTLALGRAVHGLLTGAVHPRTFGPSAWNTRRPGGGLRMVSTSHCGAWRVESTVDSGETKYMFVSLFSDGTVHTAVEGASGSGLLGAAKDVGGRWRVKDNEFSLSMDRRSNSRMLDDLRYVGMLKEWSSKIEGCVIEGQMDPAVVGKFKMTPVVASMAKDLKRAAQANAVPTYTPPKYPKSVLAGEWMFMWLGKGSVFRLDLREDGTFESAGGLGSGHLAGRWGTWDAERMYMTVVRTKSKGVHMTADHMFWGTRMLAPEDGAPPVKIGGYIMYGYLEPTCLGKFVMSRVDKAEQEDEDEGENKEEEEEKEG